ncbi:MAG TPA: M23 family metallopeptidase [Rhodothermales bacterium]|nr:M23 family metallopeptidase [Rhodothermales bacterium]
MPSVLTDAQDARGRRIVWRVLRWVPLAIIVGTTTLLGAIVPTGGLPAITAWYLLQSVVPLMGGLALAGTVGYTLWKRRWSPAIAATLAVSVLALVPLAWAVGLWPVAYPASLARTRPVATVRLPMDGQIKVGWGGDQIETNYHAASPDQRWAYDLLVSPYLTGSTRLQDYGCYGRPVLAPAAGTVAVAHDGEPDAVPGTLSDNADAPFGNYVALRLDATGTYLVLAHLKPGNVAVRAGQHVAEGTVLGQCGNSGNTSEPHVHLHHQRENPADVPVGFAEGLPLYFRDHDGRAMPEGGLFSRGGRAVATGDVVTHRPGARPASRQ